MTTINVPTLDIKLGPQDDSKDRLEAFYSQELKKHFIVNWDKMTIEVVNF